MGRIALNRLDGFRGVELSKFSQRNQTMLFVFGL